MASPPIGIRLVVKTRFLGWRIARDSRTSFVVQRRSPVFMVFSLLPTISPWVCCGSTANVPGDSQGEMSSAQCKRQCRCNLHLS